MRTLTLALAAIAVACTAEVPSTGWTAAEETGWDTNLCTDEDAESGACIPTGVQAARIGARRGAREEYADQHPHSPVPNTATASCSHYGGGVYGCWVEVETPATVYTFSCTILVASDGAVTAECHATTVAGGEGSP